MQALTLALISPAVLADATSAAALISKIAAARSAIVFRLMKERKPLSLFMGYLHFRWVNRKIDCASKYAMQGIILASLTGKAWPHSS
jgi:hypothetical protein